MSDKLKSRKFWICVAAFLASISTGIAGVASGNEIIAAIGIGCGIFSTAIYSACEAAVDVARENSEVTNTLTTVERNINLTSNDKETAKTIMISESNVPVMEDE